MIVDGRTDIAEGSRRREAGDHAGAYTILAAGLAAELPESEWVDQLRGAIERELVEMATRVIDDGAERAAQDIERRWFAED